MGKRLIIFEKAEAMGAARAFVPAFALTLTTMPLYNTRPLI